MTDPSDAYPRPNPVEVFANTIHARQQELEFLLTGLQHGMEVVSDVNKVNETILASTRPDLVMTEPVAMMPIDSPYNLGRINNFVPSLTSFGMRIYEEVESPITGKKRLESVGRKPLTREVLDLYFFMGARGTDEEHFAFAESNGISDELAADMRLQTHIGMESFMRMWILFPELTEFIITNVANSPENKGRPFKEEVFVAYSLMSRLVDRNDVGGNGAVKADGTVDDWLLCH